MTMTKQNQSPVVTDAVVEALEKELERQMDDVMGYMGATDEEDKTVTIDGSVNLIALAQTALEAALPSGVRVKPLEWVLDKPAMGDRYTAQSSFGEYTVRLKDGYMWEPGNESFPSTHDDPKAAAQADYERRILSSIEPAPSPSHAETVAPYAAAPAPAELEVVAHIVEGGDLRWVQFSDQLSDADKDLASVHPLVRLTDAQAAIAAKDGGWERAWLEQKRAEAAEARVAELEKAMEPFARGSIDVSGAAVILGYPAAREALDTARCALHPEREG